MSKLRQLLLCAIGLGIVGCGPNYDHTDITPRASVLGGTVSRDAISVPEGMIVTAHVVPYNSDNKVMGVTFHSSDESTLVVQNVISDHDFAFVGLKPGTCDITLSADNDLVLTITATVTAQPAP